MVPKDIRGRLRLTAGTTLLIIEEDDRLVLVPDHGEPQTRDEEGVLVFVGELSGPTTDHRELRVERLAHLADGR